MKQAIDIWNEVTEPAQTDQELRWQEAISLALYADDTLPDSLNGLHSSLEQVLQVLRREVSRGFFAKQ